MEKYNECTDLFETRNLLDELVSVKKKTKTFTITLTFEEGDFILNVRIFGFINLRIDVTDIFESFKRRNKTSKESV